MKSKTVNLVLIITALFILVALAACTKDQTSVSSPTSQTFVCAKQTITYSVNVKPILDQYCALSTCHAGINSSGIYLDSYISCKQNFGSAQTVCTIKHEGGCKPMPYPPGTNKLADSLIAVIDCWVQQGLPN